MAGMNNARKHERKEGFIGPIISRSTLWARFNTDKLKEKDAAKGQTLVGKLANLATQSKYRANKSGLGHEVNCKFLQDLWNKQAGKCALSGLDMTIRGERGTDLYWNSVSIDRIDSSKGYLIGNVQLVCTGVNYMKKDMSDDMFIRFCKTVTEKQNG